MHILGLLGMHFDDVVVQVEKYLLFFRLALAILNLQSFISSGVFEEYQTM